MNAMQSGIASHDWVCYLRVQGVYITAWSSASSNQLCDWFSRRTEEFSLLEVIDQLSFVSVLEIDLECAKPMLATTPVFALTLG